MPVSYEGVKHGEILNGQKRSGVFDVSHMGEFLIGGPNALGLIQKVTSNDASDSTIGNSTELPAQ